MKWYARSKNGPTLSKRRLPGDKQTRARKYHPWASAAVGPTPTYQALAHPRRVSHRSNLGNIELTRNISISTRCAERKQRIMGWPMRAGTKSRAPAKHLYTHWKMQPHYFGRATVTSNTNNTNAMTTLQTCEARRRAPDTQRMTSTLSWATTEMTRDSTRRCTPWTAGRTQDSRATRRPLHSNGRPSRTVTTRIVGRVHVNLRRVHRGYGQT